MRQTILSVLEILAGLALVAALNLVILPALYRLSRGTMLDYAGNIFLLILLMSAFIGNAREALAEVNTAHDHRSDNKVLGRVADDGFRGSKAHRRIVMLRPLIIGIVTLSILVEELFSKSIDGTIVIALAVIITIALFAIEAVFTTGKNRRST